MNGTNYEVPHCGAFSTPISHPSWTHCSLNTFNESMNDPVQGAPSLSCSYQKSFSNTVTFTRITLTTVPKRSPLKFSFLQHKKDLFLRNSMSYTFSSGTLAKASNFCSTKSIFNISNIMFHAPIERFQLELIYSFTYFPLSSHPTVVYFFLVGLSL